MQAPAESSSAPLNVLLITGEDHGTELGCYGDTQVSTPNFDRLAAEGARFTRAWVTQAVCSPGRSSILTGLYPHQNGQIGLQTHGFAMFRAFATIPSLLKAAGYRTGRIGKLHVAPEAASPFDWVWNPKERWSFKHRDVYLAAEQARDFIQAGDEPFMLMVNYPDAHLPWLPQSFGVPAKPLAASDVKPLPDIGADSERLREMTADYYNCLQRLDTGLGALLDTLEASGKASRTLVVYVTDHGPQFSRGKTCCNELGLRAPLLIRWPGVFSPGTVRDDFASQIDLLPTIAEATGISLPRGLPGRSLRRPPVPGEREYLFAEWNTSHAFPLPGLAFPQRAVRDGRYKLIANLLPGPAPQEAYYTGHSRVKSGCSENEIASASEAVRTAYQTWREAPPIELYDLSEDPYEFHNLADDPAYASVRQRLQGALQAWREATADPFLDPQWTQCFMEEHQAVAELGQAGRPTSDFRWRYLENP